MHTPTPHPAHPCLCPAARQRVLALLRARAVTPLAWGRADCATWAADVLHAATGRDLLADLRGLYRSPGGACRLLRRRGLAGLHDALAARLQPVQGPPQDLDVAILPATPPQQLGALAVRIQGWLVGQGTEGLVIVPQATVCSWWRAGA